MPNPSQPPGQGLQVSKVMVNGDLAKVTHKKGASPETIKKAAISQHKQYLKNKEREKQEAARENIATPWEAARLGAARFVEPFIPDPLPEGWGEKSMDELREAHIPIQESQERQARGIAGVDPEQKLDTMGQVISVLSDPTSLVGPAKIKGIGSALLAPAINAATAVPSAVSSVLSANAVYENTDYSPFTKELLATLAGTVGGVAGGSVVGPGSAAVVRGASQVSPAKLLGESQIRTKVAEMEAAETGDLTTRWNRLKEIQAVAPGIELPLFAATDNPVIRSVLRSTTAADPAFRAKIEKQIKDMEQKLQKSYKEVIGDPDPVDLKAARRRINRDMHSRKAKARTRLRDALARLDKKEADLAKKFNTGGDEVDLGRKMNQLSDAREQLIRNEANALYDKALNNAAQRGTEVPPEIVQDLYNETRGIHFDDIFAGQPSVASKAQKLLAPDKRDIRIVARTGEPLRAPEDAFEPMSLKDLDSLKRATNQELRKTKPNDPRYNKLVRFKGLVEDTRTKMGEIDPEFVKQYAEADQFYYEQLGLPLQAEGMQSISRSKFQATTAKQLLDPEKAASYLHFVGSDDGMPVLRHALRLQARKAGVVDSLGQIDESKLNKFVRSNERLIKLAGMEQEFTDVGSGLARIRESAARHEQRYKEKSMELADGFWRAFTEKELPGVMNDILNHPDKRARYMNQINKLPHDENKVMKTALQQEFLRQARRSPDGMPGFLEQHKDAAIEIYGKDHINNVNKFFSLRETLDAVDQTLAEAGIARGDVDIFQDKFGVSFAEASGQLRNQVLSPQRKMINLVAKGMSKKGAEARDARMQEILADPAALEAITRPPLSWPQILKQGVKGAQTLGSYYLEALSNHGIIGAYRGEKGAEAVIEDRRQFPEREVPYR